MKFWKPQTIEFYVEKYGPVICGFVLAVLGYLFGENFNLTIDDLEKIFNLVITITTVIIGFVGVLLGIIATIKDKPAIQRLWSISEGEARKTLKNYFMNSLHFGAVLIFYSIFLLIVLKIKYIENNNVLRCLEVIWTFLCGYSIGSSYRVIRFVMIVLFSDNEEINSNQYKKFVDENKAKELQSKYAKKY